MSDVLQARIAELERENTRAGQLIRELRAERDALAAEAVAGLNVAAELTRLLSGKTRKATAAQYSMDDAHGERKKVT